VVLLNIAVILLTNIMVVKSIIPLSKKTDFNLLRENSFKIRRSWFSLYYLCNSQDAEHAKIAFSIPRYIGTAVERNKKRRQLRSIFNMNKDKLFGGMYLIVVNKNVIKLSFQRLQDDINSVLNNLHT
jgi:ribonuclease P protein component